MHSNVFKIQRSPVVVDRQTVIDVMRYSGNLGYEHWQSSPESPSIYFDKDGGIRIKLQDPELPIDKHVTVDEFAAEWSRLSALGEVSDEPTEIDADQSDTILQTIVYGEVVYG